MKLSFTEFGGLAPKFTDKALPDNFSAEAVNVRFDKTGLVPWRTPQVDAHSFPHAPKTIYKYNSTWFSWTSEVDVQPAPLVNDPHDYVVFTDDSFPRITRADVATAQSPPYPKQSYRLGVTVPDTPLNGQNHITVTDQTDTHPLPEDNSELEFDRVYKYTLVDAWGRESAGALASEVITAYAHPYNLVTLDLPSLPQPTSSVGYTKWRVYRATTGAYEFIGEGAIQNDVTPVADTIIDDKDFDEALEIMITDNWMPPPDDDTSLWPDGPLQGLITLDNGSLCGFSGRTLCFSEPNIPHAWPVEYQRVVPTDIVAVAPIPSGVLVLTKDYPHVYSGSDAASMSGEQLNENQACIAKRSVVRLGEAVFYASPDGLCAFAGNEVAVLTKPVMTRDEWAALYDKTKPSMVYEGAYVHPNFVFDYNNQKNALGRLSLGDFDAHHYDTETDTYYVADGFNLYRFNEGVNAPVQWRSKTFTTPHATHFPIFHIDAETDEGAQVTVNARFMKNNSWVERSHTYTLNGYDFPATKHTPDSLLGVEWYFTITNYQGGGIRRVAVSTEYGDF